MTNSKGNIRFKLTTVAKALGVSVDDGEAHDALYDTRRARAVFQRLRERWKKG